MEAGGVFFVSDRWLVWEVRTQHLPRTNSAARKASIAEESATKKKEAIMKRENPLSRQGQSIVIGDKEDS
jgi:hypothetical protein